MIYRLEDLTPSIHPTAWVADSARVIGDVELAESVSVWYGAVLRGDTGKIAIGARTNIQDNAVLHGRTIVGQDCVIAHLALVHACVVGDGVLIGNGALVYDGVEIGDGAFIGAGALVVPGMKVPANTLMLGAPAKPRGQVTEAQRKMAVDLAASYLKSMERYKSGLRPWEEDRLRT
jgi:carbonic anhydrase/acetyltransferase-like protein (isoleucine patch superfamily)